MDNLLFLNKSTDINQSEEKTSLTLDKKIHIRIQQRNKSKSLTIVEGMPSDLDLKKIAKSMRQTYKTSCSIIKTEDEFILQLAGDQRNNILDWLLRTKICSRKQIIIHGF